MGWLSRCILSLAPSHALFTRSIFSSIFYARVQPLQRTLALRANWLRVPAVEVREGWERMWRRIWRIILPQPIISVIPPTYPRRNVSLHLQTVGESQMRESNRLHDNCNYPDELIYKSTICSSVIYIQYSPCRQIHSINTSMAAPI